MLRNVVGGVDTHADLHVAAAIDGNGGVLGIEAFPADTAGYERLLSWLTGFQKGTDGILSLILQKACTV